MTTAQKLAIADRLRAAAIEAMDEVATLEELAKEMGRRLFAS